MNAFFKELFEYSHQMNENLISVMEGKPEVISEKCIKLQSHILNAHQVWNSRIQPNHEPFGIWQIHPVEIWEAIEQSNFETSLKILDSRDLDDKIQYTTSMGQVFTNTIKDIFFHAVNHSTYHRGQLASEFKQIGLEPLVTDYIFYKR